MGRKGRELKGLSAQTGPLFPGLHRGGSRARASGYAGTSFMAIPKSGEVGMITPILHRQVTRPEGGGGRKRLF